MLELANAFFPIDLQFVLSVTLSRFVHPSNALSPTKATVEGISICFILDIPLNASSAIEYTGLEMVSVPFVEFDLTTYLVLCHSPSVCSIFDSSTAVVSGLSGVYVYV